MEHPGYEGASLHLEGGDRSIGDHRYPSVIGAKELQNESFLVEIEQNKSYEKSKRDSPTLHVHAHTHTTHIVDPVPCKPVEALHNKQHRDHGHKGNVEFLMEGS